MNLTDLLTRCELAYTSAEGRLSARVQRYRVADITLRLTCNSEALFQTLHPAMEHLAVTDDDQDDGLEVKAWQGDHLCGDGSCGLAPPESPTSAEAHSYYLAERIKLSLGPGGTPLNLLNLERRTGYFNIIEGYELPSWERAAPLRFMWHWWLQEQGRLFVHAGAVADGDSGCLLVGNSGAGKSTAALSCLAGGMNYLGDDYCSISSEPEPVIFSLFCSAKLDYHHLSTRLPEFTRQVSHASDFQSEKAVISLYPYFPKQIQSRAFLRAIVLPRVTGISQPRLVRVSQFEALQALAPSSLMQLPGLGQTELSAISQVVRRLPCYRLEFGSDLAAIAPVLRSILR